MFGIVGMDYFYGRLADGRTMGKKKQGLATIRGVEPILNLLKPT